MARRLIFMFLCGSVASETLFAEINRREWERREERIAVSQILEAGTARQRTVTIQMRRIRRDGGQPIILSHAVVLNNKAMRELGHSLWEKGFDVWLPNMRGHGSADELSRVEPYFEGDYGFDKIVTEDWPLVLHYVCESTHQKVSILGYSMGGMTWEQYLSGVYEERGGIYQSDRLARQRAQDIKVFIGLVVPPDLEQVSDEVKFLLQPFQTVFETPYFVPLTSTSLAPTLLSGFKKLLRDRLLGFLAKRVYDKLPHGIVESKKLENPSEDFKSLVLSGLSAPHTDTIKEFMKWFYQDYASKDGHVSYARNKKVYVPTLLVAATEDSLAPATRILEKALLYPKEAHIQILVAQGYAHIDIHFKRGVRGMADTLVQFLRRPLAPLQTHSELGFWLLPPFGDKN